MGLLVFSSVESAIKAGFEVWDKYGNDYLIRRKTAQGYFEVAFAKGTK